MKKQPGIYALAAFPWGDAGVTCLDFHPDQVIGHAKEENRLSPGVARGKGQVRCSDLVGCDVLPSLGAMNVVFLAVY